MRSLLSSPPEPRPEDDDTGQRGTGWFWNNSDGKRFDSVIRVQCIERRGIAANRPPSQVSREIWVFERSPRWHIIRRREEYRSRRVGHVIETNRSRTQKRCRYRAANFHRGKERFSSNGCVIHHSFVCRLQRESCSEGSSAPGIISQARRGKTCALRADHCAI